MLGEHGGHYFFTKGQRAKIGGQPSAFLSLILFEAKVYLWVRYYVSDKNTATGEVFVVGSSNHPSLFSTSISVHSFNWLSSSHKSLLDQGNNLSLTCKLRSQHHPKPPCEVKNQDNNGVLEIRFSGNNAQRAPTAGQILVLYDGERCLGGGVIK